MPDSIEQIWTAARETAVSAGHLILEKWSQPRQISEKRPRDVVTDADFAAQTLITNNIRELFPSHGFLTEEKDDDLPKNGDIIWIIDPIDGTVNYSRQHAIFCVSLAAARPTADGYTLLAAAVYDPMQDELFHAAKGKGAWLNEQTISVSTIDTLDYTVFCADTSYNKRLKRSMRDDFAAVGERIQGLRVLGSATLGLAWVAAGRFDGYLNYNLRPWDVAAAWLLIEEAGGTVSNHAGGPVVWDEQGMDFFASNGRIHAPFLNFLHQNNPSNYPKTDGKS